MPRIVTDTLDFGRCESRWASAPARHREANAVKLAPNTVLVNSRDQYGYGVYKVVFHATPILTFHGSGVVTYRTGGHRTATTKERLNRFGPCRVWQKGGEWYIANPGGGEGLYYDRYAYVATDIEVPAHCLTGAARELLAVIRRGNDWSLFPILADALADGGAEDALTNRLRGPFPWLAYNAVVNAADLSA